jgi:hypothetical protein
MQEDDELDKQTIRSYHLMLTEVFGGDYWQDIMWRQGGSPKDRETKLMEAYRAKLAGYLPYTGSCPVRESSDGSTKYFIVFASPHRDTMTKMNDIMANAYLARMHDADYAGTLFETMDWRQMRSVPELDDIILSTLAEHPGESRKDIWFLVVQKHFMRYLEPEYKAAVLRLANAGKLTSPTPRATKRLNDSCRLYLS